MGHLNDFLRRRKSKSNGREMKNSHLQQSNEFSHSSSSSSKMQGGDVQVEAEEAVHELGEYIYAGHRHASASTEVKT